MESNEFVVEVTVPKIRNLGVRALNLIEFSTSQKSIEFSTSQATAFLALYAEALHEKLNETIKDFVTKKLGV